jgi:hypothetical protein
MDNVSEIAPEMVLFSAEGLPAALETVSDSAERVFFA